MNNAIIEDIEQRFTNMEIGWKQAEKELKKNGYSEEAIAGTLTAWSGGDFVLCDENGIPINPLQRRMLEEDDEEEEE